jgi:uncharacterized RDD family membrane protein YckC
MTADSMQYPNLIRRIMAIFYDCLLLIAIWFVSSYFAVILHRGEAFSPQSMVFKSYLVAVGTWYILWFWTHGGQTTGMLAWHIKLVAADGQPVKFLQAVWRLCLAIPLSLCIVGLLWALFDKDKQTLYDKWAKTRLITQRNESREKVTMA